VSAAEATDQQLTSDEVLPPGVSVVLSQYNHLFAKPTRLPPSRIADHKKIPLVPGAQPVKVRPYKYSPIQKIDIEKQLKQMLSQGVIRPSSLCRLLEKRMVPRGFPLIIGT
jgi:hypothetical protein